MALNDIFTMIKADKYTQDGREELIKAQQAETEDKTYKPGEISERTGKQKQPDGSWKFPKQAGGKKGAPAENVTKMSDLVAQKSRPESAPAGRQPTPEMLEREKMRKSPEAIAHKEQLEREYPRTETGGKNAPAQKKTDPKSGSGMSKHWVQKGDEADFVERTPEEEKKMWQGVASRQSDDKLRLAIKNREGKDLNPVEKIKLETAKAELARRNASKPAAGSGSTPSDLKIQGMSKEEYIPWRMKTYKENEVQASSVWNHFAEQQKNKGKENEYDPDFHPLRDSAPRVLTGDCKIRIRK